MAMFAPFLIVVRGYLQFRINPLTALSASTPPHYSGAGSGRAGRGSHQQVRAGSKGRLGAIAPVFPDLGNRYMPRVNDRCGTGTCSTKLVAVQLAHTPVSPPLTPRSDLPTRNTIVMSINPFSMFGLVAAFDARNVQAHLTGAVDDCTVCATVSGPSIITCPAGRAAEITRTAQRRLTATEILDRLSVVGPVNAR
ncbi:hypothetical protein [Nocardia rhamnosiphila]|uniref:hypothetical protein n=2 Tax=Nocardia rhamnosiphila TaxID=426716 RepID=UPI0012DE26CB|nr:hypothetical protein [Nocardia rhamnosiphila]